MKIIADSSASRTEWALVDGATVVEHAFTKGLNPFFHTRRDISHSIRLELPEAFFGKKKVLKKQNACEVFVLLQRRWEDANGNIYAKRVGTGRERYTRSTGWVNGHRLRIYYGNIVGQPYYKSYMNLVDSSRPYYARNSKGKIVPIHEVGWDSPLATPTHIIMMFSAGCGTAYEGTIGQNLYVDNVAFIYD